MKRDNKGLIIGIFVVIVIIAVVCVLIPMIKKSGLNARIQAEMQTLRETPAAEFCENDGGKLDIKVDEMSGVYGMCNFDDGSACEIVEYFGGECLSASEEKERESSYCPDGDDCDEDVEGLNNWIEDINGIEIEDDDFIKTGDIDEVDDLDDVDIDVLYEYYENEFTSSGDGIEPL